MSYKDFEEMLVRWDALLIEVPLDHSLASRSPSADAMLKRVIDLGPLPGKLGTRDGSLVYELT